MNTYNTKEKNIDLLYVLVNVSINLSDIMVNANGDRKYFLQPYLDTVCILKWKIWQSRHGWVSTKNIFLYIDIYILGLILPLQNIQQILKKYI